MIREWLWWRNTHPSWEVISGGGIKVTPKPRGEYHISVKIPIRYTSGDNHFITTITHIAFRQVLEIRHQGTRREGKPYRLFGNAEPCQIDLLPGGKPQEAVYRFQKTVRAEPLLEKTTQCRLKRGAHVYLEGIHTDKFLKSHKWFQLEVSDE